MKRLKFTSFILAFITLLSGCSKIKNITNKKSGVTLTTITSISYSYTSGSYYNSGCSYTATLEDDKVTVTMRLDASSETYTFETDTSFMDKIEEIANEYDIASWDGFNKTNQNVLDGDSFSFSLRTDSDQSVSASGYSSYPTNYAKATDQIEDVFIELYESYYPNKQKILQNYLDEILIPKYGLIGNDQGKLDISYPYLAESGNSKDSVYFSRQSPDLEEGIIGYVITDLFNLDYSSGPEVDYYMLVYKLMNIGDSWHISFEYYTVDSAYEVIQLSEEVIDDHIFSNDGIYGNLARVRTDHGDVLLVYSGDSKCMDDEGTKTYFLSVYKLEEDGCTVDSSEVTYSTNKEELSAEMIEPLVELTKKYGLEKQAEAWETTPDDPVLKLDSKDITLITSQNKTSGLYDAIANTKKGEVVEGYQVKGSITAVRYGI